MYQRTNSHILKTKKHLVVPSENDNDSLNNNNFNLMDITTNSAYKSDSENEKESIKQFAQNDLLELENWKNKANETNNLNVKKKEFPSTKIAVLIFKEY